MELEPSAVPRPSPSPVRRRRCRLAVVIALTLITVAGLAALNRDDNAPVSLQTAGDSEPGLPTTVTTAAAGTSTTSAVSEPVTSTSGSTKPTATTARPTSSTTAPASTSTTTAPPFAGTVLAVEQPGIWVVDLTTGSLRRIADAGPFDVAGDFILTARDRQVYATPVAGGDAVYRYDAPSQGNQQMSSGYTVDLSRESVEWIEAASDGSAVLGVFAPLVGPDGQTAGRNGTFSLVRPNGEKVVPEHWLSTNFEWSPDGTKLALTSYAKVSMTDPPTMTPTTSSPPKSTLVVVGPDGKTLHGPVQGPQVDGVTTLQWAGDGRALVTNAAGGGFNRFDLSSGTFQLLPGQASSLDVGPDGRIVASRYVNNEPGVVLVDPVTGAITPFAKRGTDPRWSPDGRSVLLADASPTKGAMPRSSFVVTDAGGLPRYTLTAPENLRLGSAIRVTSDRYPAPQWAQAGRYLVVVAH